MRHDGPAAAASVVLTAEMERRGIQKSRPASVTVRKRNGRAAVRELGVSTSGSVVDSLDGTRLYADELSFHRIAADFRRERNRRSD
jgi:hypothetical protein